MSNPDTKRTIIHMDLDAFYCSVEMLLDPTLEGVPFVVGGRPEHRGVVASASYAAREYGIRSAMPTARALRLCPQLKVISNRRGVYGKYSKQVMDLLHEVTPLVEQLSIDEAFLDVSAALPGELDAKTVAGGLQARILDETALSASLGVASNKLVAKVASDFDKPHGLTIVPAGSESGFLAPMPVRELWGIGPKTAERLAKLGIKTIGQLARTQVGLLEREFGSYGRAMARHAQGIDSRAVTPERETKSISQEITFSEDVSDEQTISRELLRQSERVGSSLRRHDLHAQTIKLKLRWSDFTTLTRQTTLKIATNLDSEIYETALELLEKNWPRGRPVRLIGVGASNFGPPLVQLKLFDEVEPDDRQQRLSETVDELRERYGTDSVTRAALLEVDDD